MLYSVTLVAGIYYYYTYIDNKEATYKFDEDAYSGYSKGSIYIGDKEYLDSLENITDKDILVEDERDSDNPTMRIRNSYLVFEKNDRTEILKSLCEYEKEHPSDWNRTLETMELEWEAHNLLYYFNYKKDHTTDVDLDNNDEEKYMKVVKP